MVAASLIAYAALCTIIMLSEAVWKTEPRQAFTSGGKT